MGKTFKKIFIFIAFIFILTGCNQISDETINQIIDKISENDFKEIENEEDRVIAEVFEKFGYILINSNYYETSYLDTKVCEKINIITNTNELNECSNQEVLIEKYNIDYFTSHALIIIPIKLNENEYKKEVSINNIFGNLDNAIIVMNIESDENDTNNKEYYKTFLIEIDYNAIDISDIIDYDITINAGIFKRYVTDIEVLVNNTKYMNNIGNTIGSKYYLSYKELVINDILSLNDLDVKDCVVYKNCVFDEEESDYIYEDKKTIGLIQDLLIFERNISNIKFVKTEVIDDESQYLFKIVYDDTYIYVIDQNYFACWDNNEYLGVSKLVSGNFLFLNYYFLTDNLAVNTFLKTIYSSLEKLYNSRLISNSTLIQLCDLCEKVKDWDAIEDFDDYNVIDQIKIVSENIEMDESTRTELENIVLILEEAFKDIRLKERFYIHLECNGGKIDDSNFKVFRDEYYQLPVPIKEGYYFGGWYDENDVNFNEGYYICDEDITLYAKWVEDKKQFEFDYCPTESLFDKEFTLGIKKYLGDDKDIYIPYYYNNIKIDYICDYAFKDCNTIENVWMSDNIEGIGSFSFCGCDNLKIVYLSSKINTISAYAFKDCKSLTEVNFKEGCTSTGLYTFHNCTALKEVIFPNTITYFGPNLFQGCTNLESLKVSNGIKECRSEGNCIISYSKLCYGCKNSIIPNTVYSINEYAFYMVKLNSDFVLPNTISSIARGAFYKTSGIESITLPKKICFVGDLAFALCDYDIYIYKGINYSNWGFNWANIEKVDIIQ